MEKIIIFGNTNFSHIVRKLVEREGQGEVVAYTVDRKFIKENEENELIDGKYPIVAYEDIQLELPVQKYKILNTIGYSKMNTIREEKTIQILKDGYELAEYLSKDAIILSDIKGCGNIVLPGAFIGYDVSTGYNNIIYSSTTLTHDISLENNIFIAAGVTVGGFVKVGNNSFLGMNSTIKNKVEINTHTLVGAGAYLAQNSRPYSVHVPVKSVELDRISLEIL